MATSNKPELKSYRDAIKEAWLSLVGRSRLTSSEYDLIASWFHDGVALPLILKAIRQVAERVRRSSTTIYSLGVIRADLEQLKRKQASTYVGAQQSGDDWKARWDEDLAILADGANNPELAAICNELRRDLPSLTREQADARWIEIKRSYL